MLSYHLVPGAVLPSPLLSNNSNLSTSALVPLHITRAGNNLYADSAQVIQPDVLIANGVLHIIDEVLSPSAPAALPNPALASQAPVLPATGATSTGTGAPTPFTSALPCTSACPVAASSSAASNATSTTVQSRSSAGAGATIGPLQTAFPVVGSIGSMLGAAAAAGIALAAAAAIVV